MQAWILALAILSVAGGTLANLWGGDEVVIMTDGASPIPPKN
jgi:hypothetical protein